MNAYTIHLRELFDKQARTERFEVSNLLFRTKIVEGTFPVTDALKMM